MEKKLVNILRCLCFEAHEIGNINLLFNNGVKNVYLKWLETNNLSVPFDMDKEIGSMYDEQLSAQVVFEAGVNTIQRYKEICDVEAEVKALLQSFYAHQISSYVLGNLKRDEVANFKGIEKIAPVSAEEVLENISDGCLYRGICFDSPKELIAFIKTLKDNNNQLTEEYISSWTEDIWKAYDFIFGAGKTYYSGEDKERYGIILATDDISTKDLLVDSNIDLPLDEKAKELLKNESEYILNSGVYEVYIRKITHNMVDCLNANGLPFDRDIFTEE